MKYLGLLAALALCLIAAPAYALVIKDIDFENSGNLQRPGSPTVGFTLGAVSGQNGWLGAGTITAGQALTTGANSSGFKEVTGYGATWWRVPGGDPYFYNDGFPYALTPSAGRIGIVEYDVTVNQAALDGNPGLSAVSYTQNYWVHENWTYNVPSGYTRIEGGGNINIRVMLLNDGNVRLRVYKMGYANSVLNDAWYVKEQGVYGSWNATAGTHSVKAVIDGSNIGGSAIATLYVDGSLVATVTCKGAVLGGMRFKQLTNYNGGGASYSAIYDNIVVTQIPEPATMLLLGGGLLFGGLAYSKRR